ncbi:MAG: hypothetical protein EP297_14845 [Gammaproteobacteria bacterium]|nr:MAG: hypothetical protein EP297_14845 [Gammaproteobacteria bacterium]
MKIGNIGNELPDAMVTQDMTTATETAEARLQAINDRLYESNIDDQERLRLQLEKSRILTELDQKPEAWDIARHVFDSYMEMRDFEGAVDACDALFMAEQDESLAALGMGVWLGVTYPIDPELSIGMLQHIIDETPEDADGAAVAAVTAHYIADIRATGKQHDKLIFFTNQMMGNVARRHSQVENQAQFDFWLQKLELDDPAKFLVRLRNVVDVLVQDSWWFDREALQAELPDQ